MSRTIVRTVAFASCLVLMVAACSTSTKVDKTSAEKSVVQAVQAKLPAGSKVTAKCPGGVKAKKGESFRCTVTFDGQSTAVKINITDVKDKQPLFKLQYTQAIVSTTAYAKALANRAGAGSKAQCGKQPVVLKKPGDIIVCTVTTRGQTVRHKLRVRDTDGNLDPAT
jgi:hypothetical protein